MAFNKPRKATKTVEQTFANNPHKEKKVMFNTLLPARVHRKLKMESFITGKSMAKIVTQLVDDNIKERGSIEESQ
jgi:hypothetical protein